ncbi:hypothetical protein FNF29_03134 [Cafeteria roenbergensis]|uniref:Coenzyme Q-binding protein COQ10 START domain-containing protein n=1 Tax=Cafeteria roenbergensis TaxID=33653 RepID=A0A5A8CNC5_CAFRO|nr:hypothetical protein FNF31_06976 [Cafeteria roenbergensis]KAA0153321.1 hypothetical protein FNF29_03134 [Cafeteria roenbergensis]KAA0170404.1 hypothetical protein FNF28_01399 [Cafeteria roenbergensis]|eukprot:KAA0153321.1 hypothetical protein FNF29_03134 [Cafeteria roenbergensis]
MEPEALSHKERRIMRHSPEDVYAVVSDVARYHEFVPWCVGSDVISRPSDTYMEAELAVGFRMFTERYLSKVTMQHPAHVRAVAANTQLFRSLVNEWRFRPGPEPGTTWLEFRVDFAFKSALYAQASALFQDEVARRMVSAFEHRCDELYGRASGATSPLPRVVDDDDTTDDEEEQSGRAGDQAQTADPASATARAGDRDGAAPRPEGEAGSIASGGGGSGSGSGSAAEAPEGGRGADQVSEQRRPGAQSSSTAGVGPTRRVTAASSARGGPFRISSGLRVRRPRLRSPPPPLPDKGRSLW